LISEPALFEETHQLYSPGFCQQYGTICKPVVATEDKATYHNVDHPETFFCVRNTECLGFTFNTPGEMQIARKLFHGGAASFDFSAKLDNPYDMEKSHIIKHHSPTEI
jgi:hypothetical protein